MFKIRFYKAAVAGMLTLVLCSCNKFLDLKPQNGITSDQFWQSKEQLQAAVIGIYSGMIGGTGVTTPAANFFVWGELRADFISPGPGATANDINIIEDNILPTNGLTDWSALYRIINLCNNVIANAPGVLKKDATLTQTALNGYIGEALAIRSLMYFYLVKTFGDVPLKLNYTASDTDLESLAKTSQKTILNQIVADLKTAETDCVASYGINAYDKGRVTKFTVNALQADVYLWMDDYANCITACDKVINSGKFGLVPGDSNWFNSLYVTGNSVEGIFELQFDTQALNPFYFYFAPSARPRYIAQPLIMDNFYTVDLNDANHADLRGQDVAIHVADQSIYKYIALNPNTLRTSDISYAHWIVYRYADVLLMKAEACINSNRGLDALDIINQIRARAKALPGSAPTSVDVTDVNAMTDLLLAERAREFAFEGKRWYDLLRVAKRNNFARIDVLYAAATISVPALYQQSALSKIKDPNSLYMPIPQSEIQNDPNLVQNPFYK